MRVVARCEMSGPAIPSLLKEINRMLILNTLREGQPLSRSGLAKCLGLSKPTVSNLVTELIEKGFLAEYPADTRTNGPGRRPVMLRVNPDMGGIVAAKLGVVFVKAAVFNVNQSMTAREMKPIPPREQNEDAATHFVRTVRSVVEPVLSGSGLKRFVGMGIGIEGSVDTASGVLRSSPYHQAWGGLSVRALLEKEFGIPVFVDNGVNVAALGEGLAHRGVAKNLIAMSITHTVTAGLLVDGGLYQARNNSLGEIGHAVVTERPVPCVCGRNGCLSAMASEAAVVRLAREALDRGDETSISEPSVPEVLRASAEGDTVGTRILREVGTYLGFAIAGIVNFLNPDVVSLDGRIIRETDVVYGAAIEAFRERVLPEFSSGVSIVRSPLKGDASLVGASMLVLEKIFASPLGRVR